MHSNVYMLLINLEVGIFGLLGFFISLLLAKRMKGGMMEMSLKMLSLAFLLMGGLLVLQAFGLEHTVYAVILMGTSMLIAVIAMFRLLIKTS